MASEIKPTRSELMKLKLKIKLAKSGHNLLKKKRDGLILDFFEILKKAKTIRSELNEVYAKAKTDADIAQAIEGKIALASAATALKDKPVITLDTKNIMGVVVPKISSDSVRKSIFERGYGRVRCSPYINDATDGYEQVVQKVILAAEVETSVRRLIEEIEKTKRRVNALEFKAIPEMETQEAFIKLRLEEMERENVFRLKKIKS
ncbi:MAG: V-type ATP synthase subunit D [Nanohaloarchaea archaeon]|nr:V-type ATP synthase subunit D [Candidatus Nanohaloarchaea archaeon]